MGRAGRLRRTTAGRVLCNYSASRWRAALRRRTAQPGDGLGRLLDTLGWPSADAAAARLGLQLIMHVPAYARPAQRRRRPLTAPRSAHAGPARWHGLRNVHRAVSLSDRWQRGAYYLTRRSGDHVIGQWTSSYGVRFSSVHSSRGPVVLGDSICVKLMAAIPSCLYHLLFLAMFTVLTLFAPARFIVSLELQLPTTQYNMLTMLTYVRFDTAA